MLDSRAFTRWLGGLVGPAAQNSSLPVHTEAMRQTAESQDKCAVAL